jgi:hypothetical protein
LFQLDRKRLVERGVEYGIIRLVCKLRKDDQIFGGDRFCGSLTLRAAPHPQQTAGSGYRHQKDQNPSNPGSALMDLAVHNRERSRRAAHHPLQLDPKLAGALIALVLVALQQLHDNAFHLPRNRRIQLADRIRLAGQQ